MSAVPDGVTVLLGLGSNLGDPVANIHAAVTEVCRGLSDVRLSPVYRSAPEHGADQPDYANAVVRGRSTRTPFEVLEWIQGIEDAAGRTRPHPGASRTLDIDLLFMGETEVGTPRLTLPHPRWSGRDFVVVPLLDVAPEWRDPVTGLTVRQVAGLRGFRAGSLPILQEAEALLPVVG